MVILREEFDISTILNKGEVLDVSIIEMIRKLDEQYGSTVNHYEWMKTITINDIDYNYSSCLVTDDFHLNYCGFDSTRIVARSEIKISKMCFTTCLTTQYDVRCKIKNLEEFIEETIQKIENDSGMEIVPRIETENGKLFVKFNGKI